MTFSRWAATRCWRRALVSRVRGSLEVELAIRTVFGPTVAELAEPACDGQAARTPLVRRPRPDRLPLSYAQQRLWFIDRLEGTSTEYNMPEALHLRGELDRKLEQTINAIVERHESLRTHFAEDGGEPVQVIVPTMRLRVPVEDMSALDKASQREAIAAEVRREWKEPFDLSRGPVLRLKLLKLGELDHILLRTFHHIASDGWSLGVLNREFAALYGAYRAGGESRSSRCRCSMRTSLFGSVAGLRVRPCFMAWITGGATRGHPRAAGFADRPAAVGGANISSGGLQYDFAGGTGEGATALGRANQATLYMTLLSAFGTLLERYSAGRHRRGLADREPAGSPFGAADWVLRELAGNARPDQGRGEFPRGALGRARHDTGRLSTPGYPVRAAGGGAVAEPQPEPYTGFPGHVRPSKTPMDPPRLEGLEIREVASQEYRVRFDLEVHGFDRDGEIQLVWLYNRDLFDRWRIDQMARHYVVLLGAVAESPDLPLHRLEVHRQRAAYAGGDVQRRVAPLARGDAAAALRGPGGAPPTRWRSSSTARS